VWLFIRFDPYILSSALLVFSWLVMRFGHCLLVASIRILFWVLGNVCYVESGLDCSNKIGSC
jgi:hypothetical protein